MNTPELGERLIHIPDHLKPIAVLGANDQALDVLEKVLPEVDISMRGQQIKIYGPTANLDKAAAIIQTLIEIALKGQTVTAEAVYRAVDLYGDDRRRQADVGQILSQAVLSARGKTIRPKTVGQKEYVDAIDENTIVFGIGPAGTGKTYLAVAKAVQALLSKQVNRIILTRPAVEAGERLGFLPGTLNEKIDPYLRPLYDALHDMLEPESIPKLMGAGTIEVAPLAYMRGRTLNDAFIILDEAQNTTQEQMKMFLTRLGFNSTMVVTGDATQIDLPGGVQSGLKTVEKILKGVTDIEFCHLSSKDVIRHRLVSDIVDAYFDWDSKKLAAKGKRS